MRQPEVMDPATQERIECLDRMGKRSAASLSHQLAHTSSQTPHALLSDPQSWLGVPGEAIPEELTFPGPRHRTLLRVDAQVQDLLEEDPDTAHHTLARYPTAHINVAVVRIAAEGQTSTLQLPVQVR